MKIEESDNISPLFLTFFLFFSQARAAVNDAQCSLSASPFSATHAEAELSSATDSAMSAALSGSARTQTASRRGGATGLSLRAGARTATQPSSAADSILPRAATLQTAAEQGSATRMGPSCGEARAAVERTTANRSAHGECTSTMNHGRQDQGLCSLLCTPFSPRRCLDVDSLTLILASLTTHMLALTISFLAFLCSFFTCFCHFAIWARGSCLCA